VKALNRVRRTKLDPSSLHLYILRDLKRIHSHVCSVAYPVLEAAGELQPNRLKDGDSSELLPLIAAAVLRWPEPLAALIASRSVVLPHRDEPGIQRSRCYPREKQIAARPIRLIHWH
jgi:hypothetical protein